MDMFNLRHKILCRIRMQYEILVVVMYTNTPQYFRFLLTH